MKLATKYRPRKLSDLVGQVDAIKTIKGMINKGAIPPAIIFCGTSGSGKTTLARMLARYLNCETTSSCGKCESCKLDLDKGEHPDFHEVNMASEGGIDKARSLISASQFQPQYRMRVFLLDEIHASSSASLEALLKPIEEPPERTLWILATTDPQKLKPTIRDRCVQFVLNPLNKTDVIKRLEYVNEKEKFKLDKKSLSLIAESSEGVMRRALVTMEKVALGISKEDRNNPVLIQKILESSLTASVELVATDRAAMGCLKYIYERNFPAFYNALAKVKGTEYIDLVNKMMRFNAYLIDSMCVKDRSEHVWKTPQNVGFASLMSKEHGVLFKTSKGLSRLMAVQTELVNCRSRMQSFVVPERLVISTMLYPVAKELGEKK